LSSPKGNLNVMRRLLTGYVVTFNLRHRRSGHLFQNRYKSILCQEDTYLLELVRYIHLNPLRAKLVADLKALDRYRFCGHGALMGKFRNDWQDTAYVLKQFGSRAGPSRNRYRQFIQKGIGQGRRPELVGGGLLRSLGGWKAVKALRGIGKKIKGDENILGDGDFVERVLGASNERLERRATLKAMGYDFERLAERVAELFEMPPRPEDQGVVLMADGGQAGGLAENLGLAPVAKLLPDDQSDQNRPEHDHDDRQILHVFLLSLAGRVGREHRQRARRQPLGARFSQSHGVVRVRLLDDGRANRLTAFGPDVDPHARHHPMPSAQAEIERGPAGG
jgi:hypothetical protein